MKFTDQFNTLLKDAETSPVAAEKLREIKKILKKVSEGEPLEAEEMVKKIKEVLCQNEPKV